MRHYKRVNLSYWIYPEGNDFNEIDVFTNNLDKSLFLTINKKRTDTLGGGLYELAVKITEDISLMELAQSYAQDGVKVLIGFYLQSLLTELKELFKKNKHLKPGLDELTIDYEDCKVRIYSLYDGSIEESIESILKALCSFRLENKQLFKSIRKIHLPIFKNKDYYDLCEYRVRLNVDENILSFKKSDYLQYWGLTLKNKKVIYSVLQNKIIEEVFYTQKGYDKLFDKKNENI